MIYNPNEEFRKKKWGSKIYNSTVYDIELDKYESNFAITEVQGSADLEVNLIAGDTIVRNLSDHGITINLCCSECGDEINLHIAPGQQIDISLYHCNFCGIIGKWDIMNWQEMSWQEPPF